MNYYLKLLIADCGACISIHKNVIQISKVLFGRINSVLMLAIRRLFIYQTYPLKANKIARQVNQLYITLLILVF